MRSESKASPDPFADPRLSQVPDRIYKFMPSRFLNAFLEGASVRIGTIVDFRNTEAHGGSKGDADENSIDIGFPQNHRHSSPVNLDDSRFGPARSFVNSRTGVSISGGTVGIGRTVFRIDGKNNPIFCASLEFNEEIAENLDFEYDCCVSISNVDDFLRQTMVGVSKHLRVDCGVSCGPVIYTRRVHSLDEQKFRMSPFEKHERFREDKEFRIMYQVDTSVGAPFNIKIDTAGSDMRLEWRRT